MTLLRCLLLVVAWGASLASQAASPVDRCKARPNTLEINRCAEQVMQAQDAALNEAYRQLLARLEAAGPTDGIDVAAIMQELVEAQRAWIRFRDGDCKAKIKYWEKGSMRGTVYLGCLAERTQQRTQELRAWTRP